jgi:non-ribosomal peptide synthetase component F
LLHPVREVLVELGISAEAGIEADLRTRRVYTPQQAVTEYILTLAHQAGYGAALIDAAAQGCGEASVITWPQFAQMVRSAASSLARRGLRESDTAGIFVPDAVSHAVAVHAVRAAGATAMPVGPSQSAVDVAARLKQGRARLLITSAALAEVAIEAAERSLVRQVFAFGEAEGTTPFGSLLHSSQHGRPQFDGSANVLDLARVPDVAQVLGLDGLGADLTRRDVVVAAPPGGDPDIYTSLLDLALAAGATVVGVPLAQVTAAVGVYKGTAAIVPGGTDVPGLPPERVFTAG